MHQLAANGPALIRILVLTCPISHLVHLKRAKINMAKVKSHEDNNTSLFMFQEHGVPLGPLSQNTPQ